MYSRVAAAQGDRWTWGSHGRQHVAAGAGVGVLSLGPWISPPWRRPVLWATVVTAAYEMVQLSEFRHAMHPYTVRVALLDTAAGAAGGLLVSLARRIF